jgi:hypothetical protein
VPVLKQIASPAACSRETGRHCRNVPLDAPLGDRAVIDFDSGEPLPLFIPRWGTDDRSVYVTRPEGNLWPPDRAEERSMASNNGEDQPSDDV